MKVYCLGLSMFASLILGGCRGDKCLELSARAQIDISLQGIGGEQVDHVTIVLRINGGEPLSRTFHEPQPSFVLLLEDEDRSPRTLDIETTAFDSTDTLLGTGHASPKFSSDGCNHFTVTLKPESLTDAGADGLVQDGGPPDAGPPDAGPPDAVPPDAVPPDAGPPDAVPPGDAPLDDVTRDTLQPDAPPLDTTQPDLPAPDLPQPDLPALDLSQPDLSQPDLPQPDLPAPDLPAPDLPQPDLPQPDLPAPDLVQPDLVPQGDGSGGCVHPSVVANCPNDWCVIPAGCFTMGSPNGEPCRQNNETQHEVRLTHSFEMMRTEVSQEMFESIMPYNPSWWTTWGKHVPVESVNWHEAAAYCNALSDDQSLDRCYDCQLSGPSVQCDVDISYSGSGIYSCPGYRLPTEAEWEYAYRSGSQTPLYPSPGNDGTLKTCSGKSDANADQIAWYAENSFYRPHDVGTKEANDWGLHDLAGNVLEWCHDWFMDDLGSTSAVNPWGDPAGTERVRRGGSYQYEAGQVRAAGRGSSPPDAQAANLGFRCVRTLP